jgi:hypothetical protein
MHLDVARRSGRFIAAAALFLSASAARAQATLDVPAPSPKARAEQRAGVTDFAVDYSTPGVKGRKIWGALVPYDKVWRTGANAATKLTASTDFTFGDKKVPAGAYSLWTLPGKASWTVILNSKVDVSGANGYDEKADVARITVKPSSVGDRERLAFIFSDTTDDGTRLDLEWERLRASIPLKVDTRALVTANLDKAVGEAWRPHFVAARWLLDSNGNLDQALTYIDQSVSIKPTWWNNWVRAQVLAKKGRSGDAVSAAEKAQTLGQDDPVFGYFKDDVAKAIGGWKKQS